MLPNQKKRQSHSILNSLNKVKAGLISWMSPQSSPRGWKLEPNEGSVRPPGARGSAHEQTASPLPWGRSPYFSPSSPQCCNVRLHRLLSGRSRCMTASCSLAWPGGHEEMAVTRCWCGCRVMPGYHCERKLHKQADSTARASRSCRKFLQVVLSNFLPHSALSLPISHVSLSAQP